MRIQLIPVLFAFVVGVIVDRAMTHSPSASVQATKAEAVAGDSTPPAAPASATEQSKCEVLASTNPVAQIQKQQQALISQTYSSDRNVASEANSNGANSTGANSTEVHPDEDYDSVREMVETQGSTGEVISQGKSAEGKVVTEEEAVDGGKIYRAHEDDGRISSETWKEAAGAELSRSFYDDGSVENLFYQDPDGSWTAVSLSASGHVSGRTDRMTDGTKLTTTYGDQGEIVGRWRIDQNGNASEL